MTTIDLTPLSITLGYDLPFRAAVLALGAQPPAAGK